jgi:transposase
MEYYIYLVKTGCQWRMLPKKFPKWESVYYYYRKWASLDIFEEHSRGWIMTGSSAETMN